MAAIQITVGGTVLPTDELVSLKRSDELLWSDGTGRSASTGTMCGSVVAQKLTYELRWGVITQAQYDSIRTIVGVGFRPLVVKVNDATVASANVYRSNIDADLLGVEGGTAFYKDATVTLVEV